MRRTLPVVLLAAAVACSRAPVGSQSVSDAGPAATTRVMPAAAPAVSGGAPGKPFGEPCVDDPECTGGVCFHKRIKGPDAGRERRDAGPEAVEHDGYCSLRCDSDANCPVPPTKGKCGARGMCKRPE